jgi:hypothetical protein
MVSPSSISVPVAVVGGMVQQQSPHYQHHQHYQYNHQQQHEATAHMNHLLLMENRGGGVDDNGESNGGSLGGSGNNGVGGISGLELSLKELLMSSNGDGMILSPHHMSTNGMDMDPLTLEIEKERVEYLEKSKHLQEQLRDLKKEIEGLKLDEKQTPYDVIHQEQVMSGENKYSTLRKVSFFT